MASFESSPLHQQFSLNRKKKHIYWFAHSGRQCASFRYRAMYPLEHLERSQKLSYSLYTPSRSTRGCLALAMCFGSALLSRPANNLIVFQKICSRGPYAFLMRILVRLKSNTLLDLDDAEYLRKDDRTLKYLIAHSARCTVGSDALLEYCLKLNDDVIKSTSPVIDHQQVKNPSFDAPSLHLGWVGDTGNGHPKSMAFSHKRSLYELIFPAITESKVKIKLSLLGVKNPTDIPEMAAYFKDHSLVELCIPSGLKWEDDSWLYTEIATMDFGLSPMVDHPFNQAKSAFKAKQYLSVGVPVIGSAVGENEQFVQHGVNGFICDTKDDFVQAIQEASSMSATQYKAWSKSALASRAQYSLEAYCTTLRHFLAAE